VPFPGFKADGRRLHLSLQWSVLNEFHQACFWQKYLTVFDPELLGVRIPEGLTADLGFLLWVSGFAREKLLVGFIQVDDFLLQSMIWHFAQPWRNCLEVWKLIYLIV